MGHPLGCSDELQRFRRRLRRSLRERQQLAAVHRQLLLDPRASTPSASAASSAAISTTRSATSSLAAGSFHARHQRHPQSRRWQPRAATTSPISCSARSSAPKWPWRSPARVPLTSYALYVDDMWKVTPKFTINAGLRYEMTPPWDDKTGHAHHRRHPRDAARTAGRRPSLHPFFQRQGSGAFYEGLNWSGRTSRRGATAPSATRMVRDRLHQFRAAAWDSPGVRTSSW